MSEERVSLRKSITWGAIAFGIVLALIVGVRLDEAALTAIVGVACGVGASIPTGLLIVTLLRRLDARDESRGARGRRREMAQPPVVVVTSPAAPQLPQPATWTGAYPAPVSTQRKFAVIGEEGIDDEFDYWQDQPSQWS